MKGDILKDYHLFEQILPYKDDKEFCKKYEKVKRNNKIRFAKYIKEKQGIEVNPESIFDVHCKRLHEYKRQLLKCLHIIYIYQKIKKIQHVLQHRSHLFLRRKQHRDMPGQKEIIKADPFHSGNGE